MLSTNSTPIMPRRPRGGLVPSPLGSENKALWDLHSILVDPASPPNEARFASEQMLRILEAPQMIDLPGMIVPPLQLPPGPGDEGAEWDSCSRGALQGLSFGCLPAAMLRPRLTNLDRPVAEQVFGRPVARRNTRGVPARYS